METASRKQEEVISGLEEAKTQLAKTTKKSLTLQKTIRQKEKALDKKNPDAVKVRFFNFSIFRLTL